MRTSRSRCLAEVPRLASRRVRRRGRCRWHCCARHDSAPALARGHTRCAARVRRCESGDWRPAHHGGAAFACASYASDCRRGAATGGTGNAVVRCRTHASGAGLGSSAGPVADSLRRNDRRRPRWATGGCAQASADTTYDALVPHLRGDLSVLGLGAASSLGNDRVVGGQP